LPKVALSKIVFVIKIEVTLFGSGHCWHRCILMINHVTYVYSCYNYFIFCCFICSPKICWL